MRYLRLLVESAQSADAPQLELLEERLLDGLACLWSNGEQVTVLGAMNIRLGVSPTTVHRKLKSLRRKGLVSLRENEADNRIKYVVPTPALQRHLGTRGRCVLEAAR